MKQFRTSKLNRYGKKVIVAGVRLSFSDEGVVELSESDIKQLHDKGFPDDLTEHGSEPESHHSEKKLTEKVESVDLEAKLKTFKMVELQDFASKMNIPKQDWERLRSKAGLISVIVEFTESGIDPEKSEKDPEKSDENSDEKSDENSDENSDGDPKDPEKSDGESENSEKPKDPEKSNEDPKDPENSENSEKPKDPENSEKPKGKKS